MDVSNDREVERLGANATAVHALDFWNTLAKAAREDARILDPVWEKSPNGSTDDGPHRSHGNTPAVKQSSATTKIVLTEDAASDRRLYMRFRSNFGQLDVKHLSTSNLSGERWQSLLVASEGIVDSYNFMTLLRLDAHDIFWMTESEVSDGLSIVPRAQFLLVELSRIHEGIYALPDFRRNLQLWDTKCWSEDLLQALDAKDEAAALRAVDSLRVQWPYPRASILKESGTLRIMRKGWKSGFTESIRSACQDLLQYWNDLIEMGKLAWDSPKHCAALERIVRALAIQNDRFVNQGHSSVTRTTSSLTDLIPPTMAAAPRIFSQFGVVIVNDFLEQSQVQECKAAATSCLNSLIDEQLTPRDLVVDGVNTFDFAEVRQRPGHRVDNRYKILDSPIIKSVSERLLQELPMLLSEVKDAQYKLRFGGVVHSFPREKKTDPIPEAQVWHRDGTGLFESAFHETHCFNIFIPLIDVSTEHGTTEFIPGLHNDQIFEKFMIELLNQPDDHRVAVRAEVSAGSLIVFDVRVLHRGLANASLEERPMLYFTMSQSWFTDEHMFDYSKSLSKATGFQSKDNRAGLPDKGGTLSLRPSRLYELVSGRIPPVESSYGHPHYTTRFDLLMSELSCDAKRMQNMDAILNFCASGQQDNMANAFIDVLRSPDARAQKQQVLEQARIKRKEHREAEARAYLHYKDLNEEEDFASFATDMSDVTTLYNLTATLVMKESWYLSKLGFTDDQDGICILLAMLKAYALHETAKVKVARLEEAFTAWWHAGVDRFHLVHIGSQPARRLLVVFSSLGSGLARPEWGGSLSSHAPSDKLDVLYVLDPAFSWYCQDPTCEWKGGEYYFKELKSRFQQYEAVLFLGDSMGAAAALRFSSLANAVLVFSPQVDISSYESITRFDFSIAVRREFEQELLRTCRDTSARILIHYAEDCHEDAAAVNLLPCRRNIKLVAHSYDDHILSLHLRDEGKLKIIVGDAIGAFLTAKFAHYPEEHAPSNALLSSVRQWLPNGTKLRHEGVDGNDRPYHDNADCSVPSFQSQLDVLMLEDGSLVFLPNGEKELDFTVS